MFTRVRCAVWVLNRLAGGMGWVHLIYCPNVVFVCECVCACFIVCVFWFRFICAFAFIRIQVYVDFFACACVPLCIPHKLFSVHATTKYKSSTCKQRKINLPVLSGQQRRDAYSSRETRTRARNGKTKGTRARAETFIFSKHKYATTKFAYSPVHPQKGIYTSVYIVVRCMFA